MSLDIKKQCDRRSGPQMSVWLLMSRLLLIIALWQTPLPHIDYHCAAPQTECQFQHFAKFHTASDLRDCNLGWHVHFSWTHQPDQSAPRRLPSSDDTGQDNAADGGRLWCSAAASLGSTLVPQEAPLSLITHPVSSMLTAQTTVQWRLACRDSKPQSTSNDICAFHCTWQC